MAHLGSAVMPDLIRRYAKQPRKGVVVACVVTASRPKGRFEDIGQEVFGR
jgi:hypothetical protein